VEFPGRDIRSCAPEIVSGSKPTFESDIYSVGIILYELLAGKPPFDRDNTLSIALDKMRADVESIREINPNVPRLLESVVMKCIKRNPESRYKNAGELLSELHLCRSSILRAVADGQQPVQPAAPAPAQTTTPAVGTSQQIPAASQPAGAGAQEKMVTLGSIVGRKEGEAEAAPAQAAPPITAEKPKVAEQQSAAPPPAAVAAARNSSQPQEGVPLKKRKLPRGLVPFLIALGVLIALLAGLFVLKDYFMGGVPIGTVVVPNVEGKSVIEAKALLGNNGLVPMVIDRQNSEEIPEGYILKQLPEAGTTVKSGREVRLILSKGQEKATVPKLVGMTIEDARMLLEKSQLKLGEARKELSDQYEEGIIIDQTPAAGEERYIGRPVNVVVSSGKETRIVTMPRITDLAADQARDILEMNEIKNVRTEPLEAGGVAENAVVAQSVLEGTRVSPGQQVTMYVAAPLSDDSQSEVKGVVSLDISANEGDQEVVVMVFDRNGPREVYRNIHGPGDRQSQRESLSERLRSQGAESVVLCNINE
jgi:serine/threonine-protein kinase